jgi:hypothetical protein
MSLISDDDEHSVAAFAAAADVNQLAGVQSIAVKHRVTQGFAKGEFDELLVSQTQRDTAIRLMSQSTSGEIRPISLRTQVSTSKGASVKSSLASADCRGLKLPTQIISETSFRALLSGP